MDLQDPIDKVIAQELTSMDMQDFKEMGSGDE